MSDYDFSLAAELEEKSRRLLCFHRQYVFGPQSELHARALRRIKNLMMPLWDRVQRERYREIVNRRLAGMDY